MSFNSTRYHVDKLTKTGEIVRVEDGGYSRLYPPGLGEVDRVLLPLARGGTDRKILESLIAVPKVSNKQLCALTGLAKSTVSEHLADLTRLGVVKTRGTSESGVLYELEHPGQVQLLLRKQYPSLLKKASDRFIDLWDF
jgi:DNA-binding transcriptional ArsR family regulator